MADPGEAAEGPRQAATDKDRIQGAPERYPDVDQTDAIVRSVCGAGEIPSEPRSFDPSADAPTPRCADEGLPASTSDGRLGPQGDPAEGRR